MLNKKDLIAILIGSIGLEGCCSYASLILNKENEDIKRELIINRDYLRYTQILYNKYREDGVDIGPLLIWRF